MKVNVKKYQKKLPRFMHMELKRVMNIGGFPFAYTLGIAAITYLVRIFSYTDAGPLYAASAVFAIFGVAFYEITLNLVAKGKLNVPYRKTYKNAAKFFAGHRTLTNLAYGVFTGNVAYYMSRSRIWNEPEQTGLILKHIIKYPVGFGPAIVLSLVVVYYTFFSESFILSDDYNLRMQTKVLKFKQSEAAAFEELMEEQYEYHVYGHFREHEEKMEKNNEEKSIKVENIEDDIYASARVKRGD